MRSQACRQHHHRLPAQPVQHHQHLLIRHAGIRLHIHRLRLQLRESRRFPVTPTPAYTFPSAVIATTVASSVSAARISTACSATAICTETPFRIPFCATAAIRINPTTSVFIKLPASYLSPPIVAAAAGALNMPLWWWRAFSAPVPPAAAPPGAPDPSVSPPDAGQRHRAIHTRRLVRRPRRQPARFQPRARHAVVPPDVGRFAIQKVPSARRRMKHRHEQKLHRRRSPSQTRCDPGAAAITRS